MDVELNQEESAAIQRALEVYLSDLRMEIVDTDNATFKRELREERETLVRAMSKLAAAPHDAPSAETWAVRLWWRSTPALDR